MSVMAEIGAAFSPQEYPRLSLMSTARTIGVLFLMTLLIVASLGIKGLQGFAALRGAAGEWLDGLPEMVLVNGELSTEAAGPLLVEGPSALLAVDAGDELNLSEVASQYKSYVILRRTEIVTGARDQGMSRRSYPRSDRPFTTADFRGLVQSGIRFLPVLLLIGCLFGWGWLGLAQLLWATILALFAYVFTSGARPRPSYSRLWALSGHALIPVIAFSAVNVFLRFNPRNLGLGWLGVGTAVVFCALGVGALLRAIAAAPQGPPAGGPVQPPPTVL